MTPTKYWMAAAAALAAGVALGATTWGEGRLPLLALLLPVALATCERRLQAFLLAAGYALGTLRYAASFIGSWFNDSTLAGAGAVGLCALVTGAAWSMGYSSSPRPAWRAAAMALAWVLALAPPAALGLPGHPLIGAGFLLPGTAWLGVALALGLAATAAVVLPALPRVRRFAAVGVVLLAGAVGGAALRVPDVPVAVRGVVAVDTAWGKLKGDDDAIARIEAMGRTVFDPRAVVAVWPESAVGRYEPALHPVLRLELLQPAARAGRTHVLGLDIPMRGNRLLNAAVAFYPDGRTSTAVARQPAPLSLWRPWRSTDTFVADWSAHNMLTLPQGDRAAVIFCFEEYLPALYLMNEAMDRPSVYLVMRNSWADRDGAAVAIQRLHSRGIASLFGRPYLQAENRPLAKKSGDFWTPTLAH